MVLLEWWNLIFVLPFTAALIYLLMQAAGVLPVAHGVDADAALDHGVDLGHDVALDHDAGLDHSVDVGHGVGGDHAGGAGHDFTAGADDLFERALSTLGVGRIPLSLLLMSYCFIWGVVGGASNLVLQPVLRVPAVFIWPSIAIALVASVVLTSLMAKGLSRLMPSTETYATSARDLIGLRAEVVTTVSHRSGVARLHDSYGNLQDLACRVPEGEEPVSPGRKVVLMRYDRDEAVYIVEPDPLGELDPAGRPTG